jgi:hypothetical protein
MVRYYALGHLVKHLSREIDGLNPDLLSSWVSSAVREEWVSLGGQLMPDSQFRDMLGKVRKGRISSWEHLHQFYLHASKTYDSLVLRHAIACLKELDGIGKKEFLSDYLLQMLQDFLAINEKVYKGIVQSRKKDMTNPFRQMVYDNENEQVAVVGSLNGNAFIQLKDKERKAMKKSVQQITARFSAFIKA